MRLWRVHLYMPGTLILQYFQKGGLGLTLHSGLYAQTNMQNEYFNVKAEVLMDADISNSSWNEQKSEISASGFKRTASRLLLID
jgi:hypothetical protein